MDKTWLSEVVDKRLLTADAVAELTDRLQLIVDPVIELADIDGGCCNRTG